MKIIPLSEGSFTVDKSKTFVPFDAGTDNLQNRATGSLLVEVQPFAIVTNTQVILIDTGLGFERNGELQIYCNLKANGIEPAQVTMVLMSHLHKDHAGGIAHSGVAGGGRLSFENAAYYVQQKEMDFALSGASSSYIIDELSILKDHSSVQLLDGRGVIDGLIRYEISGGHSPFHQVFWIEDAGETAFFGGDVAPQLQQMKNKFVAKYDYDGKRCMQLRQEWWKKGQEEKWRFMFYHDIKTPVFPGST